MPGYVYAQGPAGAIYVNLYVSSETTFDVGGQKLALSMKSEMPWGGAIDDHASTARDVQRAAIKLRSRAGRATARAGRPLLLRRHAAGQTTVTVNGAAFGCRARDRLGYVTLDRVWKNGDVIDVEFPMDARRVVADRRVKDDARRVAIERGPDRLLRRIAGRRQAAARSTCWSIRRRR